MYPRITDGYKIQTPCILSTNAIKINGYGNGKIAAHRKSFEKVHGKIPTGMYVCHRCDNKACVNPEHLALGTPSENTQDAVTKGRMSKKLTVEQVREIKTILANDNHPPIKEIAKCYGVLRQMIYKIDIGKSWAKI